MIAFAVSQIWRDAHDLAFAMIAMREAQPVRWVEVRDEMRRSRRLRAKVLADVRRPLYRMAKVLIGRAQ